MESTPRTRITSLDQLRGYAIWGMVLVNYFGHFDLVPWTFKHHRTGYSYADTIAPLFIFIVGLSFRMSMGRRIEEKGLWGARLHMLRRYGLLILLGLVYGRFDFRVAIWDALVDIGLAGILALPVIEKGPRLRFALAVFYLGLYQALYSWAGYGPWTVNNSIDGGPLGPLSWAFILLCGTLAWDLYARRETRTILGGAAVGAVLGLGIGWALKVPWAGFKAEWPFSQYGMDSPYAVYSVGLCFVTLIAFYVLNDLLRVHLPHLSTLGKNPLALYLLQAVLNAIAYAVLPSNSGWAAILIGYAVVYSVVYGAAVLMLRRGWILKL